MGGIQEDELQLLSCGQMYQPFTQSLDSIASAFDYEVPKEHLFPMPHSSLIYLIHLRISRRTSLECLSENLIRHYYNSANVCWFGAFNWSLH